MTSNRSIESARASESNPEELRAVTHAKEADANDDPVGRRQQAQAIEQAMARQNVRLSRTTAGGVGPIGRAVLLIALLALVGLIGVWLVLAP